MNAEQFIANEARKQKNNDFTLTAGEIHSKPLTFKQLSERLKHIAGLCWGLSIDLQNEIKYRHALEAERERLQDEITGLREELKLVRNRENARGNYRQKTAAKSEAESNGVTPPTPTKTKVRKARAPRIPETALTPEEQAKRAKKREYNARYLAKKRAAQGGNND